MNKALICLILLCIFFGTLLGVLLIKCPPEKTEKSESEPLKEKDPSDDWWWWWMNPANPVSPVSPLNPIWDD